MTQMTKLFYLVVSFFFVLLFEMSTILAYASTSPQAPATTEGQPKPGIIMIITFENGTTKAIRSDSTNLQAVIGGYFITDPFVKASQPLPSKTVSNTVVQQLVSVFVDVSIDEPPPQLTSSKGCGAGWGYYIDDPNPICEPLDKIGEGPPPDMAFCAALGCPYNPPADSELPVLDSEINDNNDFATTPVTPAEEPPVGPQPLQPEPEPGVGNGDQNTDEGGEDQDKQEDGGGSDDDSSSDSGSDDSEEEEEE
jgi:hypothetical protein